MDGLRKLAGGLCGLWSALARMFALNDDDAWDDWDDWSGWVEEEAL